MTLHCKIFKDEVWLKYPKYTVPIQSCFKSLWNRFNKVLETRLRGFAPYWNDWICQLHSHDVNPSFWHIPKMLYWTEMSWLWKPVEYWTGLGLIVKKSVWDKLSCFQLPSKYYSKNQHSLDWASLNLSFLFLRGYLSYCCILITSKQSGFSLLTSGINKTFSENWCSLDVFSFFRPLSANPWVYGETVVSEIPRPDVWHQQTLKSPFFPILTCLTSCLEGDTNTTGVASGSA